MPSMFDLHTREDLVRRIRALAPDSSRKWGRMTAPEMVAHLTDQMRHTLGDATAAPIRDFRRWPPIKYLAIYVVPWPKGRLIGPPEAFVTKPSDWDNDVNTLVGLVERFAARDSNGSWAQHAIFGAMAGREWGVFCHKHFDHHLRQFGQ
ncbi:MAG: DUF1569 domain-containing protein [Candidatus Hydrogenedentes bacterium]|nr:DUF1569 domain-containing protein [Candidatus Hydrogenedentota bacterium]